jgi:hypothetical protein
MFFSLFPITGEKRVFIERRVMCLFLALILTIPGCSGGGGGSSASPSGVANLTLTWDAPITNTDGSRLADLAGFRINFHSDSERSINLYIDMLSPPSYCKSNTEKTSWTCTISGLTSGATYSIVAFAYNTTGNESLPSNEITKVAMP